MSETRMCRGFMVDATLGFGGDNYDTKSVTLLITDEKPEVEPDSVTGDVFAIQIGEGNDAESLTFDIEQARAFLEACQDILDRYDVPVEEDDSDDEQGM